ncbi:hypothetical protein FKP32DRAFT_1569434, partial [Trametes sanguinea]
MFPWLFPYGLGAYECGRNAVRLNRQELTRALLLYADRRFQRDRCFPFVVFNHEQIRSSAKGGYLLTARRDFQSVADRLLSLDRGALDSLIERGGLGEYVKPETDAERAWFEVMSVVDYVAGHVNGLNTGRKYQRNEIKSLIMAKGVPMFFVTFAPADVKSPLCLHFCGEVIDLTEHMPNMPSADRRSRAIASNPVGAAKFFHFLVRTLLDVLLRAGQDRDGLFGPTECYYGTVE